MPYARTPTYDIPEFSLSHLSPKDKKIVVKLLARVSEQSYRRGVQQGACFRDRAWQAMDHGKLQAKLCTWRYGTSLDTSPWLDGNKNGVLFVDRTRRPSTDRLYMENHGLWMTGLREE